MIPPFAQNPGANLFAPGSLFHVEPGPRLLAGIAARRPRPGTTAA